MRDRLRQGKQLSHQIDFKNKYQETVEDIAAEPESEVSNGTSKKLNLFSTDDKSENIMSSGLTNVRISNQPIVNKNDTFNSTNSGLVMSSKPSHKNNNLSKKEIFSLLPKQANSLLNAADSDRGAKKRSTAGILKPPKDYSRESSAEESVEMTSKVNRHSLRQQPIPGTNSNRQEYRVNQSVTYSPVSHCVTRDRANIFEKKKQRMEKIQRLRGASNQSEADKYKHFGKEESVQERKDVIKVVKQENPKLTS